jgi:hypothetical protein
MPNSAREGPKLLPGMYRSKNDNADYLISEFSFVVIRGGKTYDSLEFKYDRVNRHIIARAHIWAFDIYFSENFETIERGSYRNMISLQTYTYGRGPKEILFFRTVDDERFNDPLKMAVAEPALYHMNDDHAAFIFSEFSFVALMDGRVYNSIYFHYDANARHLQAKAHIWKFDFVFSSDYSYIESGTYTSTVTGDVWNFGTTFGHLLFQKVSDCKYLFHLVRLILLVMKCLECSFYCYFPSCFLCAQ